MEKQDSFDVSYNEMYRIKHYTCAVLLAYSHINERSSLERQKHLRGLTFFFGVGFFGYFQENLIRKNKRMKKVVSVTL